MSVPALLRLENASFGYGAARIVSGVDLVVHPGDFLGVAGPNGSGKTTLLRGMLGLLQPLEGRVQRETEAIGYVPQRETLDPVYPLTVAEVVAMGAYGRLRGLRRLTAQDARLVSTSLARIGLSDLEHQPFASLSGGQRQRALIARALVSRPRLLVLDEPTSGVDTSAAKAILALLTELTANDSLAVGLVTHQLELFSRTADSVLWVDGGRVTRRPRAAVSGTGESA
ncbi:MAG: ABC transporter [Planctomycetes bacterium]|jgi:ABC-type Mn2+/Zn2+ transport system ATPase subunit|nr:ABC transporter [Planctomycetota bacterium]